MIDTLTQSESIKTTYTSLVQICKLGFEILYILHIEGAKCSYDKNYFLNPSISIFPKNLSLSRPEGKAVNPGRLMLLRVSS